MNPRRYMRIQAFPAYLRRVTTATLGLRKEIASILESDGALRDLRRLEMRVPQLRTFFAVAKKTRQDLQSTYREYISRVSRPRSWSRGEHHLCWLSLGLCCNNTGTKGAVH